MVIAGFPYRSTGHPTLMLSSLRTSHATAVHLPALTSAFVQNSAVCSAPGVLTVAKTRSPLSRACRAHSYPMPREAPTTSHAFDAGVAMMRTAQSSHVRLGAALSRPSHAMCRRCARVAAAVGASCRTSLVLGWRAQALKLHTSRSSTPDWLPQTSATRGPRGQRRDRMAKGQRAARGDEMRATKKRSPTGSRAEMRHKATAARLRMAVSSKAAAREFPTSSGPMKQWPALD